MDSAISFRPATQEDIPHILSLIKELAVYEKAEDEAVATPELLQQKLFDEAVVEALMVDHATDGVVGTAIYFQNFSTWTGRGGMYLEDLFIRPAYRGSGTGRALMAELARICEERGWVRMDWVCLDWNPSLGFYKSIGAAAMTDWVHHRLTGDSLTALAQEA